MADITVHVATEEEAQILREMIADFRKRKRGEPIVEQRPKSHPAPDVVLVQVPEGGILGREDTTLHTAMCAVYKLVPNSSDTDLELTAITDFELKVANPYKLFMPQGLIQVHKTKSGFYLPIEKQIKVYGKPDADINYGTSGTVSIWENDADSGRDETVWFDWLGMSGDVIVAGTMIEATWWDDLDDWAGALRVSNSNCEAS